MHTTSPTNNGFWRFILFGFGFRASCRFSVFRYARHSTLTFSQEKTTAEQLKELEEKEQEIKQLKETIARKAKEEEGKLFFDEQVATMKKYFFDDDLEDEDKQLLEGHFDFNPRCARKDTRLAQVRLASIKVRKSGRLSH